MRPGLRGLLLGCALAAAATVAAVVLWPDSGSGPANDFSRWRPVSRVRVDSRQEPVQPASLVSWDHGFLMTATIGPGGRQGVLASRDGLNWTAAFPEGLKQSGQTGSTPPTQLTAYRSAAFLLGVDDTTADTLPGEAPQPVFYDVWTSTDGVRWTKIADRLDYFDAGTAFIGFAAGPRGVVLLASSTTVDGGATRLGLYATASADGRSWPPPIQVPTRTIFDYISAHVLTANASGFVITAAREISAPEPGNPRVINEDQGLYLTSADGLHWTDSSAAFAAADQLRSLADGASGTAVCGNAWVSGASPLYGTGSADGALTCWYRRHGDDRWRASLPEVGRLPDAGVAALGDQQIDGLCAAGDRFIAVGSSATSDTAEVGAIWVSPDGTAWHKLPTIASGLTHFALLKSVAEYDGVAVATGLNIAQSDTTSYEISTAQQS